MFNNKKVLILGFARSGYEAAKVLIKRDNVVIINDSKEHSMQDERVAELERLGVEFVFGSHPDDLLDDSFDYLIRIQVYLLIISMFLRLMRLELRLLMKLKWLIDCCLKVLK